MPTITAKRVLAKIKARYPVPNDISVIGVETLTKSKFAAVKNTYAARGDFNDASGIGASVKDYVVKAVEPVNNNPDNSEPVFSVDGDLLANALSKFTRITDSPLYIRAKDNTLELKAHGGKFVVSK